MTKLKYIIIGLVIGLIITTMASSFAFRTGTPPIIRELDDSTKEQLNNFLTNIWNITNGKYSDDIVTAVPTETASEGTTKLYYSGATYRVYRYLNGGWRYWDAD